MNPINKPFQRQKNHAHTFIWPTLLFLLIIQSISYAETTALKDNPVKAHSGFSNFNIINIQIDVPSYSLLGEFRFLKVFDNYGNILFLGQVSTDQVFKFPLHALKTAQNLTIELFSEDPADQTVTIKKDISKGKLL